MSEITGAGAAKLAGLQIDLLQKVRQGHITADHLTWFLNLTEPQRDVLSGICLEDLFCPPPTVDTTADPFIPDGWTVEHHDTSLGTLTWDLANVRSVHKLREGEDHITGHDFRDRLKDERNLNATVLDWLLKPEHQHYIPPEWDDGYGRYFFGTIYRNPGGRLYVRYLYRHGGEWYWAFHWLDRGWRGQRRAVVLAS